MSSKEQAGMAWQVGVWDNISQTYLQQIDQRFTPVVDGVIARAGLKPGEAVLDLGTGTGAVALRVAPLVAPGPVLGVDISPRMLALASERQIGLGLANLSFKEGRAEAIPAGDGTFDLLLASLSLMYSIDRLTAAKECARVLKPGGRFVAAVWAGPEYCDIVRFQQIAGSFAPTPPVPGVGPGALAQAQLFLDQLATAGIEASVEEELLGFDFDNFEEAWNVLASVTASQLSPERLGEAKRAVQEAMWPQGDGPRHFRNLTRFITGQRRAN